MTYLKQIDVKTFPSLSIDAFGRWRTSMPHTIFDSKLENSKQPLLWSEKLYATGSSTHTTANARARMETAASGDAAIRQTFMRFGYQPGKGQLVYFTFLAPQAANVRQRIGLFEGSDTANSVPQNGVFLEVGASDMSWNIAKGGSITETKLQSNAWGGLADSGILMDKLDGTGPSGITLDMDACQIGWFDLEWLGAGTVRAGFIINGFYQTCEFNHANDATFSAVYTPWIFEL